MGVRFDMIGVFVNDLKKMVEFYRDVLGLEIEWDGNGPYAEFKTRASASRCTSAPSCPRCSVRLRPIRADSMGHLNWR